MDGRRKKPGLSGPQFSSYIPILLWGAFRAHRHSSGCGSRGMPSGSSYACSQGSCRRLDESSATQMTLSSRSTPVQEHVGRSLGHRDTGYGG